MVATCKTSPIKATRISASVARTNPSVVKNVKNKPTGSKRKAKSGKDDDIVCSGSFTPAVQTDGLSNPAELKLMKRAIQMWKAKFSLKRRKVNGWNCMAGFTVQPGSTECGYYVMRYMRDICNEKELGFDKKWAANSNLVYNKATINEVRSEWATWVSDNLPEDDE